MKALVAGLALLLAGPAGSQDFTPASPEPLASSGAALLARGVAGRLSAASIETASTRWWGLRELESHALVVSGGIGDVAFAAGLSRFGEPLLGWNAVGLALGTRHARVGAALRTLARQDRDPPAHTAIEAGGGAWLALGTARVFASAPQLWLDGEPPPVEQPLETGLQFTAGEGEAWVAFAAAPARAAAGDRRIGLLLRAGPLSAWAEALAPPWRGRTGVGFRRGPLRFEAGFESHPVLGETTYLALAVGAGAEAR